MGQLVGFLSDGQGAVEYGAPASFDIIATASTPGSRLTDFVSGLGSKLDRAGKT